MARFMKLGKFAHGELNVVHRDHGGFTNRITHSKYFSAYTKPMQKRNVTCRQEENDIRKGVWRIDVGASQGFNNFKNAEKIKKITQPQVLEILNDNEFNILTSQTF